MTRQDHHHHHHYHHHAGRQNGEPSPNPHRLYRSPDRILGGVCAGIADYFGVRSRLIRIVAIIAFLMFPPPTIFLYLAAWWFLPERPGRQLYENVEEERFWRTVSTRPRITLSELRHRFRGLEGRIAEMERIVTSEEYDLRRKFRDLEG